MLVLSSKIGERILVPHCELAVTRGQKSESGCRRVLTSDL
jgi:hypothetical protein